MSLRSSLLPLAALCLACTRNAPGPLDPQNPPPPPRPALDQVPRAELNRYAAELYLPLFWDRDSDDDRAVDPEELAVLWLGVDPTRRADWVDGGQFTDRFYHAYGAILHRKQDGPMKLAVPDAELERMALERRELEQGRPSLIRTNLRGSSDADKELVRHVLAASNAVERIYHAQMGSAALRAQVPDYDTAGQMLFYRNHGPWCVAPETESNAKCGAIPSLPKKLSGMYPAALQSEGFCDALGKRADGKDLLHQFFVVRDRQGTPTPVPYHEAYADEMKNVAGELDAAAAATAPDEPALRAYLQAAAKAFRDGSWYDADKPWAEMNALNSKWYLRIAPDETYAEPCSVKAGFQVSFARINQASLKWQQLLDPVKGDMETAIAALAGPPYAARSVSFHLPDFIDMVLNAGDARAPSGGTAGESLPNWGPVSEHGRTVVMTNLGTDPDSRDVQKKLAESMLCKTAMAAFTTDPEPQLMTTVLHEATHNLGPSAEYKVDDKTDRDQFGGRLASMLEELKAQTGALYFTDWLGKRALIDAQAVTRAHLRDVTWAFGQISRGSYSADGKLQPYPALAAIQIGWLIANGALVWQAGEKAANDADDGCLVVKTEAFSAVVEGLMRAVAGIKARGDKAGAEKLVAEYVDAADKKALLDTITRRWLRAPKASYVYAIEM